MTKKDLIERYSSLIPWVQSLVKISDDLWFSPFAPGKWGTADVIAHFISWDQFIIDNRLIYIRNHTPIPEKSVEVEQMNKEASNFARNGIAKEVLIQKCIDTRKQLTELMEEIDEERYSKALFKEKEITLNEYLIGFLSHDQKHQEQIDQHLEK